MARWSQGTKKCVPSVDAYVDCETYCGHGNNVFYLILHTLKPIEHDCSVTSRDIINAGATHCPRDE